MRICFIAPPRFPLPGSGSVEISIWAAARRLVLRHEVTVLSRRAPGLPEEEIREGVRLLRLPAAPSFRYAEGIVEAIAAGNFDLIQVDNRPALLRAVKEAYPALPAVLYLHSLTFVPAGPLTAARLYPADAVIVNSASLADRLRRRFPGLGLAPQVVPLGADLSRFVPADEALRDRMRSLYRISSRRYVLLFAGRVIPRKGLPVLIRAAARVNRFYPVQLVVAGSGDARYIRRLRSLARRLRLPFLFLGPVPHGDMHRIYQAADCFICPSQRHEAFGLVNVEAMASGLPVIASAIGGIVEILGSGRTGMLVADYRRPSAFARAIRTLIRRPDRARAMGEEGRRAAVDRYGWEATARRLESLYRQTLESRWSRPHLVDIEKNT
ncbi:glycosyltransferase family 4 protein [Paenibacillus spiritus]|uniref:Glycosyltransferase family 4 protein n=1 Tax=Paenibacillus spiritus TaxID=2496557 RepID=A0A5J5G2L2_9BACL|nr:glycosyltransferase family 4 protein [Paenibacillus spiritus]KAA9000941.1 glycosyltransferase family 4 protein [Paenibacillus spiritus]